jgi:hypothetical protein
MTGIYSTEILDKISKASKGRVTRTKVVLQFDLDGNFIRKHPTIKDAVSSVKGERSGLYLAIKENRPYKKYI